MPSGREGVCSPAAAEVFLGCVEAVRELREVLSEVLRGELHGLGSTCRGLTWKSALVARCPGCPIKKEVFGSPLLPRELRKGLVLGWSSQGNGQTSPAAALSPRSPAAPGST